MKKTYILIAIGGSLLILGIYFSRMAPSGTKPSASPLSSTAIEVNPVSSAGPSESAGPTVKQYQVRPVTLEEVDAPNLVSKSPVHKDAVLLPDLKTIQLKFSSALRTGSKILAVLVGNKAVAAGGTVSADKKILALDFTAGPFEARNFPTGEYQVFYVACFTDGCFNGQYAFIGIQP